MKKKKILGKIIIVLIFLILVAIAGVFGYNYYLQNANNKIKEKFYSYVFQNNINKTLNFSSMQNILEKLDKNSYNSIVDVEFSNTFPVSSNLDINKLALEFEISKKDTTKNTLSKFIYSNNEIFNLNFISNDKYIGLKNNDILNNYIAVKNQNVSKILTSINPDFGKTSIKSKELINNLSFKKNDSDILNFDNKKYVNLIKKYIKSNQYLDEGTVFIEQNGNKIETQIYSLTISKQEFMNLFSAVANQLLEDESIINSLSSQNDEGIKTIEKYNSSNKNDVYETESKVLNKDSEEFESKDVSSNNSQNKNDENDYESILKEINEELEEFESKLNFKDIIVEDEKNEIYSFRKSDTSNSTQNENTPTFSTEKIEENEVISKLAINSQKLTESMESLDNYEDIINAIKYIYCAYSQNSISEKSEDIKVNLNNIFADLNEILEEKIAEGDSVKFVVYVSDDKTVKTTILLGDNIELSLEYISSGETSDELKISILEKNAENYNGYTINISKNKTNVIDNTFVEINKINDTKIVSKLELKLTIEGSEASTKFNNKFSIVFSGNSGKFTSTITNKLNFKNVEVENLNSENTLLIDKLSESDFNYFINNFNYKLKKVYDDKTSKMNLINTNKSDTIIQNNQEENNQDNSSEEKEKLANILVDVISEEMGIAIDEDREYTIQNLKDLYIEGYDIQVSVSQELAIIKINGYIFKIDKEFNLSE